MRSRLKLGWPALRCFCCSCLAGPFLPERRITQESYPGSPNSATFSPHTSCEIIHYSIQLVETSNQHYKVLITPDQSVTTVLSTSTGFYNSLLSHKKGWNFSYLKLLSPIDLRSSYLFVE